MHCVTYVIDWPWALSNSQLVGIGGVHVMCTSESPVQHSWCRPWSTMCQVLNQAGMLDSTAAACLQQQH
jgi:hypothetical protein